MQRTTKHNTKQNAPCRELRKQHENANAIRARAKRDKQATV